MLRHVCGYQGLKLTHQCNLSDKLEVINNSAVADFFYGKGLQSYSSYDWV